MNRPSAILRADASPTIGTGHVVRCVTLGQALVDRGWSVTLATDDPPDGLRAMAIDAGLDVGPGSDADPSGSSQVSLLVVDDYRIDAGWIDARRGRAAHWMAIDDLADRRQPVDLLLDQNLGRRPKDFDGLVPDTTRRLIGPTYSLVRPGFARQRASLQRRDGVIRRILVFIGGGDADDVTRRATAALSGLHVSVDIVVGGSYGHLEHLRAQAGSLADARVHVDTSRMDELMAAADLAIGAPSSASWERCTVGLPTVLVAIADNQRMVEQALVEAGAATSVGWHTEVADADIREAVMGLMADPPRVKQMAQAAAAITDGRGTSRVVDAIEEICGPGGESR